VQVSPLDETPVCCLTLTRAAGALCRCGRLRTAGPDVPGDNAAPRSGMRFDRLYRPAAAGCPVLVAP